MHVYKSTGAYLRIKLFRTKLHLVPQKEKVKLDAWTVKSMLSFVKMKTHKKLGSVVSCQNHLLVHGPYIISLTSCHAEVSARGGIAGICMHQLYTGQKSYLFSFFLLQTCVSDSSFKCGHI